MRTNFAYRKDANHNLVAEAFRKSGWAVMETWQAPHCCDLVVAKGQRVILVEVKSKGGKVSDHQRVLHESWPGETAVVTSIEDVLRLVKAA